MGTEAGEVPRRFKEGNKTGNLQVGSGQGTKQRELGEGKGEGERKKCVLTHPTQMSVPAKEPSRGQWREVRCPQSR